MSFSFVTWATLPPNWSWVSELPYRGSSAVEGQDFPRLFVVDGLTGTGRHVYSGNSQLKTFANPGPRGFAEHRSSMLGDVGLNPASQNDLNQDSTATGFNSVGKVGGLVEAESRKVGNQFHFPCGSNAGCSRESLQPA